jgi:UDP-glucose:(heptosyl)LPS alpha-1,3-glucosyltransferase
MTQRKLKVALVANNIHFRGGMERYCAELANYLSVDYDMHLFASVIDDVPLDRVTIHPVPTVERPIVTLFIQFYLRSTAALKGLDFDIIHTIGGITSSQNVITAQYCQYAWGDVLKKSGKSMRGITPYHHFMWRFAGFFERLAVQNKKTVAIIANSQKTANDLAKFYNVPESKLHVIYNGVDAKRFTPENKRFRSEIRKSLSINDDAILVLFVGEYRRKGLETVIKAISKVDNKNIVLAAFGKGDKPYHQQIAQNLGIADRVILSDPYKGIERVFGAGDIFAFPTAYEPFGMVITEAMASGLPTITTKSAGAAEFIEDGVNGFLIDNHLDSDSIAKIINRLAADSELCRCVGEKARAAVQSYDWPLVAKMTSEIYQSITQK